MSERLRQRFISRRAWLRFRSPTWREMIDELHRRGEDRRESGAFLLAASNSRLVARIVYLDDIDPDCLIGGIHLHGEAYGKLWDICEDAGLRVIGDIHTHPTDWVGQSSTDRENPMVARSGHVALIAPDFASGDINADDVGVHRYRGDEGWESNFGRAARRLVYVGRLA